MRFDCINCCWLAFLNPIVVGFGVKGLTKSGTFYGVFVEITCNIISIAMCTSQYFDLRIRYFINLFKEL